MVEELEPEELEEEDEEDEELDAVRRGRRRLLGRLLTRIKEPLGWWRVFFRRRRQGRGGKQD